MSDCSDTKLSETEKYKLSDQTKTRIEQCKANVGTGKLTNRRGFT